MYPATAIFVSNDFGTDTDETDSESYTASKEEIENNVIDLKTDTSSEGEV